MSEFKSFFKAVGGNEGGKCNYATRLDTYGCGCQHNCAYCYARALLDFRGLWNHKAPSVAPIEDIRRTIQKELHPGQIIRLGGMTDCFQPAERTHRVTLRTIEMLNKRGVGYLIVTKNKLVAEQEYLDVFDPRLAHIQVTITSTDADIARKIEPGASLPDERIEAVETLAARGLDAQVRLSPFIPELVDIDRMNAIRCDKILVEFLRVNTWIAHWIRETGLPVDLRQYTYQSSGYRHLPLRVKRMWLARITGYKERSVCEDVEQHFAFWQEAVNNNRKDCCNLKR